jgi:hypothetical protein
LSVEPNIGLGHSTDEHVAYTGRFNVDIAAVAVGSIVSEPSTEVAPTAGAFRYLKAVLYNAVLIRLRTASVKHDRLVAIRREPIIHPAILQASDALYLEADYPNGLVEVVSDRLKFITVFLDFDLRRLSRRPSCCIVPAAR